MKVAKKFKQTKNLLLIGLGPHSKRIYFPLIKKFSKNMNFRLSLIIDLEEKRDDILDYLVKNNSNIKTLFIDQTQQSFDKINSQLEKKLNKFIRENNIHGVIIATEPLTHVMYAKWALKNGLSILMDKPISTHKDISTNIHLAKKLIDDFKELKRIYLRAMKKTPNLSFSLMAQRRFHPAFKKIKKLIEDCFKQTNCPITSIQSFHCDGQWRMPCEMVDQLYHPYMQGYGKCSHSGYHFFDIVPFLLKSGLGGNKYYDNIDVMTCFVRPLDVIQQFSLDDYKKIFGEGTFKEYQKYSSTQLDRLMSSYGEVDAFNTICFKQKERIITIASINLAHNGFSRRH